MNAAGNAQPQVMPQSDAFGRSFISRRVNTTLETQTCTSAFRPVDIMPLLEKATGFPDHQPLSCRHVSATLPIQDDKKTGGVMALHGWGVQGLYACDDDALDVLTNIRRSRDQLGSGGEGVVYQGSNGDGSQYAIKLCNKRQVRGVTPSIRGELCGLMLPEHPGIATTFALLLHNEASGDYCVVRSLKDLPAVTDHFIVTAAISEYIHGQDLYTIQTTPDHPLNRLLRPSVDLAFSVGLQIAEAVQHCHQSQVIHRDLKTTNIVVDTTARPESASQVKVKLVDFGISKLMPFSKGGARPRTRTFCGTYDCMSPEIVRREAYSYESDLWTLGNLLMKLGSGQSISSLFSRTEDEACYEQLAAEEKNAEHEISILYHERLASTSENELQALFSRHIHTEPADIERKNQLVQLIIQLVREQPEKRMTLQHCIEWLKK